MFSRTRGSLYPRPPYLLFRLQTSGWLASEAGYRPEADSAPSKTPKPPAAPHFHLPFLSERQPVS